MSNLPDAVLRLTDGEKNHPLWKKIVEHLEQRLAAKRAENDNPKLDQFQTATIRGHIELLKSILAIQDVPPIQKD